jgi:thiamine-phosphate pyrophosphorylase
MERDALIEKLRLQLITQGGTTKRIETEVGAFLSGGGRWVQLRMKETPAEAIVEAGRTILPRCRAAGAVFIVNDRPELALEIGADGVHLGRGDASPVEARAMLGPQAIVGCTANTFADIERLAGYPIDYIGLGPFRYTTTKKNLSPVLGADGIRQILSQMRSQGIPLPVTVIGGITPADIPALKSAGARCYAVSGAIGGAQDPEEMTRRFLSEL